MVVADQRGGRGAEEEEEEEVKPNKNQNIYSTRDTATGELSARLVLQNTPQLTLADWLALRLNGQRDRGRGKRRWPLHDFIRGH